MDLKKHFLMTFSALFFLGIIIAKPGSTFTPASEKRECKMVKGKMDCENKVKEYRMNNQAVSYEYH